ncbi:MAG: aldo/keto reductase, partial [Gammaproteobacteria bacterium]|nr:aldo/keto reductase [Gammaproteobacteria bacterium]
MKYREVGRTGIEVSEVGFGTWELGGMEWGDISD